MYLVDITTTIVYLCTYVKLKVYDEKQKKFSIRLECQSIIYNVIFTKQLSYSEVIFVQCCIIIYRILLCRLIVHTSVHNIL